MTARTCPVCSAEKLAPGRSVCKGCTGTLRGLLSNLPDKMDALTAALGHLLRFSAQFRQGGRSSTTPVPINERASDVAYRARTALLVWADYIAQARVEATPTTWSEIQTFLDVRAAWLAGQQAGPDAYKSLIDALRDINGAIDRPRYRRIPVHVPCVEHGTSDLGERVPCQGHYYVVLDNNESWQSVPDMVCDEDESHRLAPVEWQRGMRRGAYDPSAARRFLAALRGVG